MTTFRRLHSLFFFLLFLALTPSVQAEEDLLLASEQATESWLLLLDNEDYGKSWAAGAATFKLTVPQDRWVMMMEQIRKPLGKVQERKVLDKRIAKDPKGLPAGDYRVFVYETSFSRKGKANELVTLVQESDGQWRVLTYQVQ